MARIAIVLLFLCLFQLGYCSFEDENGLVNGDLDSLDSGYEADTELDQAQTQRSLQVGRKRLMWYKKVARSLNKGSTAAKSRAVRSFGGSVSKRGRSRSDGARPYRYVSKGCYNDLLLTKAVNPYEMASVAISYSILVASEQLNATVPEKTETIRNVVSMARICVSVAIFIFCAYGILDQRAHPIIRLGAIRDGVLVAMTCHQLALLGFTLLSGGVWVATSYVFLIFSLLAIFCFTSTCSCFMLPITVMNLISGLYAYILSLIQPGSMYHIDWPRWNIISGLMALAVLFRDI